MEDCDTLLMVGTSFPYIEFYPKPGQARAVQIDRDPARLGLRYPIEVGLAGDAKRTLDELLPLLERHGVPASRLYRAPDMLTDPQFAAREAIVTTAHPVLGPIRMQNAFPKLSSTPGRVRWPGPALGEHTEAVLHARAGCSAEDLRRLREKGVI